VAQAWQAPGTSIIMEAFEGASGWLHVEMPGVWDTWHQTPGRGARSFNPRFRKLSDRTTKHDPDVCHHAAFVVSVAWIRFHHLERRDWTTKVHDVPDSVASDGLHRTWLFGFHQFPILYSGRM
jgi:hypothetical protein